MQVDQPQQSPTVTSKLDMALDDLTKRSRQTARKSRGSGKFRQDRKKTTAKPKPAVNAAAASSSVQAASLDFGSKILVSNLHYGVTEADLKELFSAVGPLKKHSLAFDASGKSKGTAEIEFVRKNDALLAVKKYQNVALDGRPLKLEMVAKAPATVLSVASRLSNLPQKTNNNNNKASTSVAAAPANKPAGKSRPQGRKRRGQQQQPNKAKTAEELDAEMTAYMAGAAGDTAMADA